jgi:hypothetical protein
MEQPLEGSVREEPPVSIQIALPSLVDQSEAGRVASGQGLRPPRRGRLERAEEID